ncbi:DUF1980 domain-containing protein, partial [Klebsiella pneumoniae]|nr:DUF1980 domain-containing protein [Klebsiella pneumoniae]MCP6663500.1 DUF1980 domain-containing protein [Klebsiella pneumoniae]
FVLYIKLSGQNLLKLLVLMGFSLLFYITLTTPGLSQVIHPQFIWNAKLGFTLLVVLTIIQMFKTLDWRHNITCGCHHKTGQLAYIVFVGTLIL